MLLRDVVLLVLLGDRVVPGDDLHLVLSSSLVSVSTPALVARRRTVVVLVVLATVVVPASNSASVWNSAGGFTFARRYRSGSHSGPGISSRR